MSCIPISIDHGKAAEILESAFLKASIRPGPGSAYADPIREVILGAHLTYRYVLVTNLLAKATNKFAHGLALQAGADLDGAFDSRSLCHSVVVPFERRQLGGRLGRSNEHYLNKPARQKQLALDNPVRRGKDKRLLERCIAILSELAHVEALDALADALYYALQRPGRALALAEGLKGDLLHSRLIRFCKELLADSHEGETSVLIAGLGFCLLARCFGRKCLVKVHPANQAGASSNEVSDIDVYAAKTLAYTAEVKDKRFTLDDIDHAAAKVRAAGHDALFFIVGPRGSIQGTAVEAIEAVEKKHGVKLTLVEVEAFFRLALGVASGAFDEIYVGESMNQIVENARFKDATMDAIRQCLERCGFFALSASSSCEL